MEIVMGVNSQNLLQRNLEFLKEHSSENSFNSVLNSVTENLFIENSNSDNPYPVYYVRDSEGNLKQLHSRRNPEAEAQRQIEAWRESNISALNGMIVALGFGGMYHLEQLSTQLKHGALLFIADPNPGLFKAALTFCDLDKLKIEGVELFFSVSEDLAQIKKEFRLHLSLRNSLLLRMFCHPGSQRAFPDQYKKLLYELRQEADVEKMDRNTIVAFSDEWQQNAIYNLPYALKSSPIDFLKNRFAGKTALVAGAGPSLNDSIPFISEVRDKVILFSVGTALKPLFNSGIRPDFVVAIDSDPRTMKQYDGIDCAGIYLLTTHTVFPNLMNLFKDRMFVFSTLALKGFYSWLRSFGMCPDPIACGGTVAISTIDSAAYCGCREIILTGMDLAFTDDGTSHAKNSMYDGSRQSVESLIKVKGNYREQVLTSRQFANYIRIMNNYLENLVNKYPQLKLYNATDDGAALNNVELINSREIPQAVKNQPGQSLESIDEIYRETDKAEETKIIGVLDETMAELSDLRKVADSALQACKIICASESNMIHSNRLQIELDRLDEKIKNENKAKMLLTAVLEALFFDIYSSSETESETNQLAKNQKFYEHLKGAAEWLGGMLKTVREGFGNNYNFKINI
jgi:hypothetical protein